MLSEQENLPQTELTIEQIKVQLSAFTQTQYHHFLADKACTAKLIRQRSDFIDNLLTNVWHFFALSENSHIALLAVGGFGRKELHPLSDIDLLLLCQKNPIKQTQQKISQFIAFLWDLGLEVGHSTRTIEQCVDIGKSDLTVATSLQEARFIIGNQELASKLNQHISSNSFWSSAHFFHAKVAEQKARHARFNDTAYNLEPDIKSTPGGLRDIHTLHWIAHRQYGATTLHAMSKYGFLTDAECRELKQCQLFLWQIRFALHMQLRRCDNRLTFPHQAQVANVLGYRGEGNQAIERMMKDFYRTLRRVIELNKMLLRFFEIEIQPTPENHNIDIINDDFLRCGKQIEARKPALFQAKPETILDLFLHIAQDPSIKSIAAPTLRQLRTARRRMNRSLYEMPVAQDKFITLLRHPNALIKALPLMHKHGVLSIYFPQWNQIVGQMQFDLFHAYTVDEHTIRLLKHINNFRHEKNREKHPICFELLPHLAKPELLILAAIFHDIGKGRGGDHSEIGAIEAYDFCLKHNLSHQDSSLVSWLVAQHLLMSVTAQRRDIYDPDVIRKFSKIVATQERLNYLICLTVADICATNPTLWNSWKRTLISELFYATQKMLRPSGQTKPNDAREQIRKNQQIASNALQQQGFNKTQIHSHWQRFKAEYFLRHSHQQITWHAREILKRGAEKTLVLISEKDAVGFNEIFIYCQDKPSLFACVVAALDKKNLNVHDAQIMTSKDGFALDTFMIFDANNQVIAKDRHQNITNTITNAIEQNYPLQIVTRKASSKLMAFNFEPQISFLATKSHNKTLLELIALDTPGLLANIGAIFATLDLSLQAAKITTIGERAEDFFIISTRQKRALDEQTKVQLKAILEKTLSR